MNCTHVNQGQIGQTTLTKHNSRSQSDILAEHPQQTAPAPLRANSKLQLDFRSGAALTRVGAMPNRPIVSSIAGCGDRRPGSLRFSIPPFYSYIQ
jgi:hypothetical protein